ncbi:MAG: hypothetical protein ABJC79_09815, partial [Acidimicrobiia bacterium]
LPRLPDGMTSPLTAAESAEPTVPVAEAPSEAHPVRRRVLLALTFVALLLLMLRPSWHTLTTKVPDLGDPVLYGWGWNWTRHALFSSPAHLFDGNIFWRHDLTIAYTDNMLVLLAPFSILRGIGASWALQLNALAFGMLFVSLAATYSLARRITGRLDASLFAAVAYTFGSFTFMHQGHLQLLLLGQFPLGFLLAFRWLERRRATDAIWFGLVNASFFLGALYYSAVWMVCVAVVLVGFLITQRGKPGPKFWSGLVLVAVFSATAIPFVIPYLDLGQERPLVPEWGLQPRDIAIVPVGSILYPGIDSWANRSVDRGEHSFFPGFSTDVVGLIGLGALILATANRRSRLREIVTPSRRRELWLLLFAGAAAVVLSLGPEVHGHRMPFAWFHDNVPGFAGIRVSARLAVPGLLALAVLAAFGITVVVRQLRGRTGTVIAIALTGFLLLELAAPLHRVTLSDDAATLATYRALEGRPSGAVAELPIQDPIDGAAWARVEAPRMLYSTLDLHPRINGYSGSWPTDYPRRREIFNTFPEAAAVTAAHRLGVRYLILHVGPYAGYAQYTPAEARAIVARLPAGAHARHLGNAWLVDLGPTPR